MRVKKSELEHYRRQRRKKKTLLFSGLMEITGDLAVGSKRMAEEYYAAVKPERTNLNRCSPFLIGEDGSRVGRISGA